MARKAASTRRTAQPRKRPARAATPKPWPQGATPLARGIASALTGALASLIVILILAFGAGSPAVRGLERIGADIGMQARWSFGLDREPNAHRLVFVDIDLAACERFPPQGAAATAAERCKTGKPASAELVAAFAATVRQSEAAVVILDIAPFEDPADLALLRQALAGETGPYLIAPFAGRPAGEGRELWFRRNPAGDIAPSGAAGRLRLASFQNGLDPEAGDGMVRLYAAETVAVGPDGANTVFPSAPLLAAALASPERRAAADCRYYGLDCRGPRPAGAAISDLRPIVFSLPSQAALENARLDPATSEADAALIDRDILAMTAQGYERLAASQVIGMPAEAARDAFPKGAIVVLGTSLPSGLDLHPTPLGTMSGSEILLNATRAWLFAPPGERAASGRPNAAEWWDKLGALFVASLIMLPFWWLIHRIGGGLSTDAKGWRAQLGAAGSRLAMTGLFAAGLLTCLVVEFLIMAGTLEGSLRAGRPVDVLTPILALGLDGYVEGVKYVTDKADHWFGERFAKPAAKRLGEWGQAIARIGGKLAKPR